MFQFSIYTEYIQQPPSRVKRDLRINFGTVVQTQFTRQAVNWGFLLQMEQLAIWKDITPLTL